MVLTGWHSFNAEQVEHGEAQLSLWAVFAIVVPSITLRVRGSSESKPVAVPHATTGT